MFVCGATGSEKKWLIYSMLTQPTEDLIQPAFKHVVISLVSGEQFFATLNDTSKPPLLLCLSN